MPNKLEIQFVACPKCEGHGRTSALGTNCPNCSGIGLGSFLDGVFLYWGRKLGRAGIALRRIERRINLAINLIAYLIGLGGLACLGWWIYRAGVLSSGLKIQANLDLYFFWRFKNWVILFFWFGLLSAMFVIYRLSRQEEIKTRIKRFKKGALAGQAPQITKNLPNNWAGLKKYKGPKRKGIGRIGKLDVAESFSSKAVDILEEAFLLTLKLKQNRLGIIHLFFSLLSDPETQALFVRLNVDGRKLIDKIKKQIAALPPASFSEQEKGIKAELSIEVKEALIEGYVSAYNSGQGQVRPINLILPCLKRDSDLREILFDLEADEEKVANVLEWFRFNDEIMADYRAYRKKARFKPGTVMDRAYTAVATPVLDHFGHDLVLAAKRGRVGICAARDKEIENIFNIFESGQAGAMLVGPAGVGKRTIVGGLARLMVREEVPKFLRDKRLIEVDVARLVSGADPSEAERRLLVIIDEVAKAGNIVLFINNIENLIGLTAGAEESLELSEVLANALERRELRCLGAATDENYLKYIEGKPLAKAMPKVDISEPVGNQAIRIVESQAGFLEGKYKVYFDYNAIEQAVKLSDKFIHDKYLPAKAIEILEKVAVKAGKEELAGKEIRAVSKDDVAEVVSEIAKVPVQKITQSESQRLLNLEDNIHERMIDQEEAVKMVASSLRRARAEMREGKRPIASFLFLGPTGVGKTELAKTVAQIYFGDEKAMIRVDMSEYQHPDSVKKMIGDSTAKGYLTEAVRRKPFALVLLDEFEKAHPDILNLFLQVMDDGRLTSGQGRTVDFTNSIIIATSNAGSVFIQEQVLAGVDILAIKEALINEHLNKVMKPELINRFDGLIVFKPLSQEDVAAIAKLMLGKTKKMLEAKGMDLEVSPAGLEILAQEGYDPKFGARPLRRLLQDKVEDAIANKIISGELKRRDVIVINDAAEIEVRKGREI